MKPQSQVSVIALVTFLTMAVAMMIALICISNLNSTSEPVGAPDDIVLEDPSLSTEPTFKEEPEPD